MGFCSSLIPIRIPTRASSLSASRKNSHQRQSRLVLPRHARLERGEFRLHDDRRGQRAQHDACRQAAASPNDILAQASPGTCFPLLGHAPNPRTRLWTRSTIGRVAETSSCSDTTCGCFATAEETMRSGVVSWSTASRTSSSVVMPQGFAFPINQKLWVPLTPMVGEGSTELPWTLRIWPAEPGVTATQARQELDALASRLASQYPETNEGWVSQLRTLRQAFLPPDRAACADADDGWCHARALHRVLERGQPPAGAGRRAAGARSRCGRHLARARAHCPANC